MTLRELLRISLSRLSLAIKKAQINGYKRDLDTLDHQITNDLHAMQEIESRIKRLEKEVKGNPFPKEFSDLISQ